MGSEMCIRDSAQVLGFYHFLVVPGPKIFLGMPFLENLSLNTLSGLLPSAGARLRIYCQSLSSTKSVDVDMVSVTPAGDLH